MSRRTVNGMPLVVLLLLAACQGGGKFQYFEPDLLPTDVNPADVAVDVPDAGPGDPGPDAGPQCGPGLPADTCDLWAKDLYGACKKGRCNLDEGLCQAFNEPDGTACDDQDPCTTGDACTAGDCGGEALTCDDGVACTTDRCEPGTGCVYAPDDAACGNGNPCDGVERCDPTEGCMPGSVATSDSSCDGVDDDCDGVTDEEYVADAGCLDEACGIGGRASSCADGVETPCTAPAAAADDATCDGVDDDCSGAADEDYVAVALCGLGACGDAATASTCAAGVETPCQPGAPAADDSLCNGADDDCDGATDEEYVVVSACGLGVCAADPTPSSCTNGVETPCQPGAGAADDASCNGRDDDCDGGFDEDYVAVTACGTGPCVANATPSFCLNGIETPCQPAPPAAATDTTCNAFDDDCDGTSDEDYVPVTSCGEGACGAAPTPSACAGGVETPCQPGSPAVDDATCDGRDDDCDGTTDEDYVPVASCGLGACALASTPSSCAGGVETACQPGTAAADDATCNGVDDDCDGTTDQDWASDASCLGGCGVGGTASTCVNGTLTACRAPVAAGDDTTCDGVDDDCDATTDEDYVPDTTCLAACGLGGAPSACADGTVTPCAPPVAAGDDATCDGIDDDCSGAADDDFVADTTCGVGACLARNTPSACSAGVESPCVPGDPAPTDANCDGSDDDCDGTADEDADPPCGEVGDPVAGADVVFASTLGLPTGIVADHGDGTYGSEIVDLTNPSQAGLARATVNGNPSADRPVATAAGTTTTVRVVSSRPDLHADDNRLRAYAYVTDALGSPVPASRAVTFRLTGAAIATAPGTSSGNGLSSAFLTAPAGSFTAGGNASLVAECDGVTSAPVTVTVRRAPAALVLEPGEAGIEVPLGPRFDNTTFDVPVYVNTGSNTLGSYDMRIDFDPAVLEVVSVGQGSATDLAPPVSNAATTANTLGSLSFNAINANPSGTNARGARVQVAMARFRVKAGVAAGARSPVSGAVLGLYNTVGAGVPFLANPTLQVRDGDGQGDAGFVDAKNVVVEGIFARMDDNTLLHTRPLDGLPVSTGVAVLAVTGDGGVSDVRSTPGTSCQAVDGAVASTTGCTVTAAGGGFTPVTATVGAHEAQAALWVLAAPLPLDVRVSDPLLQPITGLGRSQQARPSVRATFTDGDRLSFDVDVTARVRFGSSDAAVLSVDATSGLATAGADGTADVQALGEGGALLGAVPVTVDGTTPVTATGLAVLVPATVILDPVSPNPVLDEVGRVPLQALVTNLFTAEGKAARASALLVLSDDEATAGGSRVDVSADPATTWESGDPLVGTVDAAGVVTAVGGGESTLTARLGDGSGGEFASGTGSFLVQLPMPERVEATVADPRLALSDTDVAATLLGLPTSRPIAVRVFFEDGTNKDFTADPRTAYDAVTEDPADLLSVEDTASCAGAPGCVPGTARSTGNAAGRATIGISFPGTYLQAVSTSIELEVVTHADLTVESWELHTPVGLARTAEHTLSLIEGTTARQRSRLQVLNAFTDGSVLDVTTHPLTTFDVYARGTATPAPGVLSIDGTALVQGLADGEVDLVARNSDHGSAPLPLAVDGARQDLSDLALTYPGGATFLGIKDAGTGALSVVGTFADGTHNVLHGAELIPGLLAFASSDTRYATVADTGVMTTRGNGPVTMTVDVDPAVDTGAAYDPPKPLPLPVNLLPDVGDVDLGNPAGLAFPDRVADEFFDMPVRVNTGGRLLGGIDLEVTYDPAVLVADSARVGAGVPGALFSANVSEPGILYLNASPPVTGAGVSGTGLEVAVLRFKAIKLPGGPSISPMGGTVRGFIDRAGATIGADVPRPIVAGAGDLDPDSDGLFGDANDDGQFSIGDVLFVQQITVVPPLVAPNPTQLAQSDLFPDGQIVVNDAFYASQVLARLSHFVEGAATPDPAGTGEVDLRTLVVDRDQQPVTAGVRVRYEVATTLNAATITFTGAKAATASGVITDAVHVGGGTWATRVSGLQAAEAGIGVVVILDVLDGGGAVVNSTAFLETPLLDPAATFKPLFRFDATGCGIADTTCDGRDDDCNGATDDGYVPATCGLGACASASACVGGLESPCVPGLPAADDATCDGVDEDCSGAADEDYVPDASCGEGACQAGNAPSTCVGGLETACVPGQPGGSDGTCDGIDDDCDGLTDQQACHDGLACWDDQAACDDGLAFTDGDTCRGGDCSGTAPDCAPYVDFGDVLALTDVTLGTSGFPGQGLDVDGDPATCAPAASGTGVTPWCSDGIDNQASLLEALLNPLAADFLAGFTQGSVLADFQHASFDGVPFLLPLYVAEVGPTTPGCDPKVQSCDYVLPRDNFDGQCNPMYVFDNARIVGTLLTAGGPGTDFTVPTRYGVSVTVFGAQVRADLEVVNDRVASALAGSLAGGAVRPFEALVLLDAAFPGADDIEVYPGYTKGFVRNLLQNAVTPDVDTDGDLATDAISFGLLFEALRGQVVDVGTPCTTAADCDDGNPCTDDACLPEAGCTQAPREGAACDDGDPTTLQDTCQAGACVGLYRDCTGLVATGDLVAFQDPSVGESGFPGQGLDVDGDPATCAPATSGLGVSPWCSDGIDNALSVLAPALNPLVTQAWAEQFWGTALADFRDARTDGVPFPLYFYVGGVPVGSGCDVHGQTCPYDLPFWNFDAQCVPKFAIEARIVGDRLLAGGPGYDRTFDTWSDGPVTVTVYDLQVDAQVVFEAGRVVGLRPGSLFAGALKPADALSLMDGAFPGSDDVVVYGTYTKGFVRNLLQNVLQPDIDTDDDGTDDAVSSAVLASALTAGAVDYRRPCASDAQCDDGNPCTSDGCTVGTGCYHNWLDVACDDGDPATTGDRCVAKACVGVIRDCGDRVTVGDLVAANDVQLGTSGFPGQGLDVDGDPATCAPAASGLGVSPWCSDGIDNELSKVEGVVNPVVDQILASTTWGTILGDFQHFQADGVPFRMPVYLGATNTAIPCDFRVQSCTFDLPYFNFGPDCEPAWAFDNAVLDGERLTAGGPGYDLTVDTWAGGGPVSITIHDVQVDARVRRDGDRVLGIRTGSLAGGAFRLSDALLMLDVQFPGPEDVVVYDGFTKGFVRNLLQNLLVPDVDVDGDGVPEAVSVGALFSGLGASYGDVRAKCSTHAECDDGNPCTSDGCWVDNGCYHHPVDGACDDGDPLTVADACEAGRCQGRIPTCNDLWPFGDCVRLDDPALGTAGVPGQGLDVDGDPATCAPSTLLGATEPCTGGVDNMAALLSDLLAPAIAENLAALDSLTYLGDLKDLRADGQPFPLYLYRGQNAPPCDPDVQTCAWEVQRASFDDTCRPLVFFDNARWDGTVLTAGGPGHALVFEWDEGVGSVLLTMHAAAFRALPGAGGPAAGFDGVFGGAFTAADVLAVMDLVVPGNDDTIVYGTYTKGFVRALVQSVLMADVDVNGDGVPDAISVGGTFRSTPALAF